jgi:SAM-dependent methyltransferase
MEYNYKNIHEIFFPLSAKYDSRWIKKNSLGENVLFNLESLCEVLQFEPGMRVLDLGCGPGLYAERLYKLGHSVTGIDFSRRSINYAKKSSEEKGYDINYFYKNYLEIDYENCFDLVILIYCDFGALTDGERDELLKKIYRALKPGGVFVFDVFTEGILEEKKASKNWYASNKGFWSGNHHMVLSEVFHYPENKVFLDQDIVITGDNEYEIYRSYTRYYSAGDLTQLLSGAAFKNQRFFYNIIPQSNFAPNSVVFVAADK